MQTIEIQTPQNVAIEFEIATLRERILAFFIDFLALLAIYLIFFFGLISTGFGSSVLNQAFGPALVFFFFPLGLFMGYHLIAEKLNMGQSWGKKAIGIRVIREDGREPSAQDYLLRILFHLIETLSCAGILATLLVSATPRRQRLGDMAAHTVVVRLRSALSFRLEDILGINAMEDYSPMYPRVVELTEQDMLTVKNVLARYQEFRNRAHAEVIVELSDRISDLLEITERPLDPVLFLKQILRDFVVLTR